MVRNPPTCSATTLAAFSSEEREDLTPILRMEPAGER